MVSRWSLPLHAFSWGGNEMIYFYFYSCFVIIQYRRIKMRPHVSFDTLAYANRLKAAGVRRFAFAKRRYAFVKK
jgi:hypothetical protein